MDELHQLWAENIVEIRRQLGETQVEFAERMGVTQQTVSSWERGETAPRDRQKVAIAQAGRRSVHSVFPLVVGAR